MLDGQRRHRLDAPVSAQHVGRSEGDRRSIANLQLLVVVRLRLHRMDAGAKDPRRAFLCLSRRCRHHSDQR
jgi:hypothetical protein